MGLRFTKRVSLIPGMRVNLSKHGASLSVGHRGAWFTVGPPGHRATLGVPGTGLYCTESGPVRAGHQPAFIVIMAVIAGALFFGH
jgi:hypothetical protein